VAAVAAVLFAWLSAVGLVIAAMLSLPWLGFRYDNRSGTFFVLGLLSLFLLAVPALLLFLMALMH